MEKNAICRKGLINEIALRLYSDLPASYFISSRLQVVTGKVEKANDSVHCGMTTNTYIHTYTHTHAYTHTYIYIHTYTHTYIYTLII